MKRIQAESNLIAQLRIRLTYFWRHGRLPNLADPGRFTELVQLRKLYDRDPRLPVMADKLSAKKLVSGRLGSEWVIPTLWSGTSLPDRPKWDQPIVVKARHGCKQYSVFRPGESDWARCRRSARKWMLKPYGAWLDEWLYSQIPRGLLIEPFIGEGAELPIDYKVYVFHGRATHVQAHIGRATNHRWVVHDTRWQAMSPAAPAVAKPSALPAMLDAAEELARDFSFARIDFYQPGSRPLFGEMTFYPGSGLDPFDPGWLDEELGRLWLNPHKVARCVASKPGGQAGLRLPAVPLAQRTATSPWSSPSQ